MEPVWVIIVILYLVFTALGRSARRQVRRPPGHQPGMGRPGGYVPPLPPEVDGEAELSDVAAERSERDMWAGPEPQARAIPRRRPEKRTPAAPRTLAAPAVVLRRRYKRRRHVPSTRPQWASAVIAAELIQPPRAFRPYRIPRR